MVSARPLESATLFTPGRGSYLESSATGCYALHLTAASAHRAQIAAQTFDPDFHQSAVFAGGYPGISQQWSSEQVSALGSAREAPLLAAPLINRLLAEGYSSNEVRGAVYVQGDSNSSIGDVRLSVERGLLDPEKFSNAGRHGITLVAGGLHGTRLRAILVKALDLDPRRILRVHMHDRYGTPATQWVTAETSTTALARELAAIFLTKCVLRDVREGNLGDLEEAEARFNRIVSQGR